MQASRLCLSPQLPTVYNQNQIKQFKNIIEKFLIFINFSYLCDEILYLTHEIYTFQLKLNNSFSTFRNKHFFITNL